MAFEFDEDTALEQLSELHLRGAYSSRWNVGPVPNGGYVMALALRALARVSSLPEPLSVTAHYLRRAEPAPVDIYVEKVREGRSHATLTARLVQAGEEQLRVLATFGSLAGAEQPAVHAAAAPPGLPPLAECSRFGPGSGVSLGPVSSIGERFDQRFDPASVAFMRGQRSESAQVRAWCRFADGRPADVLSLALFADACPPPVFNVLSPNWVPTLELTVHFRGRPRVGPGDAAYLRVAFRTRWVSGGYLEEDGEIFDSEGRLVAMSRQLAGMPRQ